MASFWALRRKQINELRKRFIDEELAQNPALAQTYSDKENVESSASEEEHEPAKPHSPTPQYVP